MKRTTSSLVCALLLPLSAEEAPRAIQVTEPARELFDREERVVSGSKQFSVSGGDEMIRGTIALLAEETKHEWLSLTEEKDDWKVPVHIRLHGSQGDPLPVRTVSMSLIEIEGIRELRVDVHLSKGIDYERFKRAVVTAMLYERALKVPEKIDPDAPLVVPPWLADGLREAIVWRQGRSDRRLYQALFRQGGLFKPEDLFNTGDTAFDNLDGATRVAFRVSAGALVMALLEQPQGRESFRAFLTSAASHEGEMPGLLARHFPELNLSEDSLRKWWALQLANKGGLNQLTDLMTIAETEAALEAALVFNFRTPEGIIQQKSLDAWPDLAALAEAERIAAVRSAEDALVRLSFRCFPSYRPLLQEYQTILVAISRNKTADVAQRLGELDESRVTMLGRSNLARDFMDWFEITRARETSGAFDDYLRLKERLKSNPQRRKDQVSTYLDRMERIFHREENDQKNGVALPR